MLYKMEYIQYPKTFRKKCNGNFTTRLKGIASQKDIIRERISPKNPPYINSKNRVTELYIESELHSKMNIKRYPALAYINFRNWSSRNNNEKSSYLDTLYAKNIAEIYKQTHVSAFESKIKLRNLTTNMQKLTSIGFSNVVKPRTKRTSLRKTMTNDAFKTKTKISSKYLAKLLQTRSKEELENTCSLLDSLNVKLSKPK